MARDEAKPVGFRCECARLGCNLLVEVPLAEYEHIRSDPRQFVMIPGHEMPEVETVVERTRTYVIVREASTRPANRPTTPIRDRDQLS